MKIRQFLSLHLAPKVFLWIFLLCSDVCGLRYDFGDGRYYVGSVDESGRPNGRGLFFNSSGSLEYDGEFLNGLPHGQGTWFGADGSVLKGQFKEGHSDGPAQLTIKNGDVFEGDFLDLKPHGNVEYIRHFSEDDESDQDDQEPKITRIVGEFRYGMPHGSVTVWYGKGDPRMNSSMELKNGIKIEGTFRMGRPHGHARIVDLSENEKVLYDGKFLNGRPLDVAEGDADRELLFKKIRLLND